MTQSAFTTKPSKVEGYTGKRMRMRNIQAEKLSITGNTEKGTVLQSFAVQGIEEFDIHGLR